MFHIENKKYKILFAVDYSALYVHLSLVIINNNLKWKPAVKYLKIKVSATPI